MQASGRARRWLVATALSGGVLLLAAVPAFASHEGPNPDDPYCHYPDSSMADVEDGPVTEDTDSGGWCYGYSGTPIPTVADGTGRGGAGGAGDADADAAAIVPAARIDAGGGGAAAGASPGSVAAVLTAGSLAIGAVAARRRR